MNMDSHSNTARSRLDKILKDLADKAAESAAEEEEGLKISPAGNDTMPPPTTPSKKGVGRAPRKRRKKEVNIEEYMDNSRPTYILKLFDRSVDMAQFRRDSSMYVMARAWTQNKPRATYELGQKEYEILESQERHKDQDPQFVHSLEGPIKEERHERLKATNVRNVNKATRRLDNVVDTLTDMSLLKTDNISRWRKVRSRWRDTSLKEQERYSASLLQLKQLFTQP